MATDVDICNLALLRIGSSKQLASLADRSVEGLTCALLYAMKRDAALASFPWPFATKRASLVLLSRDARPDGPAPTEAPRQGWAHVYALPADCLAPAYLWAGKRNPLPAECPPFALELATTGEGRVLLTDVPDAVLVYVAPVTLAPRFPPLFVDALAWLLAGELALALRKDANLGRAMLAQYQAALAQAGAQALREQQRDGQPEPEHLRVRG